MFIQVLYSQGILLKCGSRLDKTKNKKRIYSLCMNGAVTYLIKFKRKQLVGFIGVGNTIYTALQRCMYVVFASERVIADLPHTQFPNKTRSWQIVLALFVHKLTSRL